MAIKDVVKGPLANVIRIDSDLCPGDKPAQSCQCLVGDQTISAPYENPLQIMVNCAPQNCSCDDGSNVDINGESLLARVRQVCPNGPPTECTCADDTKRNFPFDLLRVLKQCRPKSCTCQVRNFSTLRTQGTLTQPLPRSHPAG